MVSASPLQAGRWADYPRYLLLINAWRLDLSLPSSSRFLKEKGKARTIAEVKAQPFNKARKFYE